jgi:hypothetical protein
MRLNGVQLLGAEFVFLKGAEHCIRMSHNIAPTDLTATNLTTTLTSTDF